MAMRRRTVYGLAKWLAEEVATAPHREVPLVCGDLNTGFGLRANGSVLEATPSVGAYDKGPQNYIGDKMVQWMARNSYCAINSYYSRSTTYVGHDGRARRLDYLMGPLTMRPQVSACSVWRRWARRVQASPWVVDHQPIVVKMEVPTPALAPPRGERYGAPPLDKAKMAQALNRGIDRERFLERVSELYAEYDASFAAFEGDETPDRYYHLLVVLGRMAAEEFYGVDRLAKKDRPEWYRVYNAEKVRLLAERGRLRRQLGAEATTAFKVRIQEVDKRMRRQGREESCSSTRISARPTPPATSGACTSSRGGDRARASG